MWHENASQKQIEINLLTIICYSFFKPTEWRKEELDQINTSFERSHA